MIVHEKKERPSVEPASVCQVGNEHNCIHLEDCWFDVLSTTAIRTLYALKAVFSGQLRGAIYALHCELFTVHDPGRGDPTWEDIRREAEGSRHHRGQPSSSPRFSGRSGLQMGTVSYTEYSPPLALHHFPIFSTLRCANVRRVLSISQRFSSHAIFVAGLEAAADFHRSSPLLQYTPFPTIAHATSSDTRWRRRIAGGPIREQLKHSAFLAP